MYTIREATPADDACLSELVGKTLQECLDEYVLPDELEACVDVQRRGVHALSPVDGGGCCFVVEDGSQLVGYGVVGARSASRTDGFLPSVSGDRLYVRRSWHGKGIAKALADAMQPHTALITPSAVEAWRTTMRTLYTRWGFVDVGVLTMCMSGPSHMMHAVMEVATR